MKNLKTVLGFLMMLATITSISSLEMTRGKLKLDVNASNGRFLLLYTSDVTKPLFVPLFYGVDPTTTKVKIMLNDQVYVLGDDSEFKPTLTKNLDGMQITWTSPRLTIIEKWTFVASANSPVADGIRWSFHVVAGAIPVQFGLRIVLDTYLGEKSVPFITSDQKKIDVETAWTAPPDALISPSSTNPAIGLLVMLGQVSTVPDLTVVANWKRLNDSNWSYNEENGRDFNFLPYSYRDSALALWYNAQPLAPRQSRDITITLGASSAHSFVNAKAGSGNEAGVTLDKTRFDSADLSKSANENLQILTDVLNQITIHQKDPSKLSLAEQQALQATLDRIAQQKSMFQSTSP